MSATSDNSAASGGVSVPSQEVLVAKTELRAGALNLLEVVMQAVTLIAPSIGILFTLQFAVGLAGVVAPLVYLITFPIVLMLGLTLSQLARAFPSAGGYFTYVSRTIHPRVGFFTAWLFFLYTPLVPAPILAYMGYVLQNALKAEYNITFPWWLFFIIAFALVAIVVYRGIEISGKTMLILGSLEILIVGVLSIWGIFAPGPGGFNVQPFNLGNAAGFTTIFLAVVFSIFAFTGWEGAAPIAEESEDPVRNVPRATIAAILFQGIFLIVCTWGLELGWGTLHMDSLVQSANLPPIVLAHKFWGGAWVIVLLALINSTIAVSIAACNVSTRMWFAMGRSGALPHAFARVDPKTRVPITAVLFQLALIVVSGIGGVLLVGVDQIWFVDGLMLTFALIIIYSLGNIGLFLYYLRERRSEFNLFLHGVFPILSTVFLAVLLYESLVPYPALPSGWAPLIVAVWLVVGVVVLFVLHQVKREDWIAAAGQAVEVRPETPEELAHRPRI